MQLRNSWWSDSVHINRGGYRIAINRVIFCVGDTTSYYIKEHYKIWVNLDMIQYTNLRYDVIEDHVIVYNAVQ